MMERKHVFLIFFALGTTLPTAAAILWMMENNATPIDFVREAFSSWLSISLFLDILICALATVAAFHNRIFGKHLAAIAVAITFFGPCSGLPLYFYFRETSAAS